MHPGFVPAWTIFGSTSSDAQIPLTVLAGADVRVEPDLVTRLEADEVLTLADHHRHVLLELPHELYFPLEPVLSQLGTIGLTGILSHPERNLGLLSDPSSLGALVDRGCLMQITASSLLGGFGKPSQLLAESMLEQGLVHFVASDGHSTERRRPKLQAAYQRVVELTDAETAQDLCCRFPTRICQGMEIPVKRRRPARVPRRWFAFKRSA